MSVAGTLRERRPRRGELVQVRSRRWLVDDVDGSRGPCALVRLACADDDAQGESLEVYWDDELDRRIFADEGWDGVAAKGFDVPRRFSAFLHILRWGSVTATNTNLFRAPFRGRDQDRRLSDGAAVQGPALAVCEPLHRGRHGPQHDHRGRADRSRAATAQEGQDDRGRRVSVVLEQWKAELEERFGLVFEIVDYVARARREHGFGIKPWNRHSRLLVSHNLLSNVTYADPMRAWLGAMPRCSLLILDEAHHAAPSSGIRYRDRSLCAAAVLAGSARSPARVGRTWHWTNDRWVVGTGARGSMLTKRRRCQMHSVRDEFIRELLDLARPRP